MSYGSPLRTGIGLLLLAFAAHVQLGAQSTVCAPLQATANVDCINQTAQLSVDTNYTSYTWTPSAGLSSDTISNPIATAAGTYSVTANYQGPNLVVNPDFAAGNTGFTSGMNFSTVYTPCNYWVGTQWFMTWFPGLQDHTPTADNMFMMIDGCIIPRVIWEEQNFTVQPGADYKFSYWATEAGAYQPIFEIHFIGNVTGDNIIASIPGIPAPASAFIWDQYSIPQWNAGPNTSVTIRIVNQATQGYGVDFGMDDFDFHRFCSATDSVQVSFPAPVNLGSDISQCDVTAATLDAGPGGTYLWNTGDTTQTIIPPSPGIYWVTYDNGICVTQDTIMVNAVSVSVDLGADTALCDVTTITLDAGTGGSYLWNTGDTTQMISPTGAGTFWITYDSSGCIAQDTIVVSNLPIPIVSLGNDTALCNLNTITLDAGPGGTYLWSTGATTETIVPTVSGPYWVNYDNGFCVSSDTIIISNIINHTVSLGPDVSMCDISTVALDAGPDGSYLWNTGDTTQTISPGIPGIYWVTCTIGVCVFYDTVIVSTVAAEPVRLGDDVSLCELNYVQLDAGPSNSYLWSTGETTETISPTLPGIYYVTTGTGNCATSDTIELVGSLGESVLYMPNTVTPDGNGLNDVFYVYSSDITDYRLRIFDRWGELIYESTDMNAGWDATFKGEIVQEDTYVYVVDYKTTCNTAPHKEIGHVNVVR